jgi:acyl-CoA reductase-like NAD-dependent aldehyde dehydrogenase
LETIAMQDFRLLIDGHFVAGAHQLDVINPATEQSIARCPVADELQLNAAVAAAKKAFPAWSAKSVRDRAHLVGALGTALAERAEEFARQLTAEQGKPVDQARMEIMASTMVLRAFSQMDITPKILRENDKGKVIEIRAPLGVVATITPWNFPIILLMHKVGPALLAGNTIVIKPAPTTPLTTLLFGTICQQILPPGVINIICDRNDLGTALTTHPDVAKVAFTGSTATGKKVMAAAAGTLKRITLELGGNDAAIILDDVDPAATAAKIFRGAMANAGQMCVAIKRAYVPSSMYDAFCDQLALLAKAAVVDEGTVPGAQIGPVQNRAQYDKLKDLLADVRKTGNVIAGGTAIDRPGFFIAPTIVRDVTDSSRIVCEEQFGPILPVLKYDSIDEVVARVNDSTYGLGGSIWSKDIERAIAVAARIQSGTVCVNQSMAIDPVIPFRGAKQSGVGGELGEEGLFEYTQPTVINAVFA